MLADWHRGSWFQVRGGEGCTLLRVGAGPGDAPAEVVFALAFVTIQSRSSWRLAG